MRSWGGYHFTYEVNQGISYNVQEDEKRQIALRSECRTMNHIARQGREIRAMFDIDDSEITSRASGSNIGPLTKIYEVKEIITPYSSSIFKQHLHGKQPMVLP